MCLALFCRFKKIEFSRFFDLVHQNGLLLLVGIRVLDHPVFADEPFSADVTGERLLAGVETHVTPEVSLVVELLGADVALVRFVPGMLCQMFLEKNNKKVKEVRNNQF